jgi:methyl-accepting chemotaxis protein
VSYVQGFEPWGWVVGSGIYVGDLQEALLRSRSPGIGAIVRRRCCWRATCS